MIYQQLLGKGLLSKDTNLVHLKKAASLDKVIRTKKLSVQVRNQKNKQLEEYKILLLNTKLDKPLAIQQESNSSALNDLMSHGDCPICMDSMFDKKIFACSNDHWVCEACLMETRCHMCREDFADNPPRRCYTAEQVVKDMHKVFLSGS